MKSELWKFAAVCVVCCICTVVVYAEVKKYTTHSSLNEPLSIKHSKLNYPVVCEYGRLVNADDKTLVFMDKKGVIRVLKRSMMGKTSWEVLEYFPEKVQPPK